MRWVIFKRPLVGQFYTTVDNKVGVDAQIADQWMVVGEGEDFLLSLLTEQPTKIFKSVGASFERL